MGRDDRAAFREAFDDYQSSRITANDSVFCHAPFSNLNFDQSGNATACCYNRKHVLGTYPQDTLLALWFGAKADELRSAMRESDLSKGCALCQEQLLARNFKGLHASHFDGYGWNIPDGLPALWPRVIEFELSNVCNFECVMCSGHFSSLIRRNREQLPALQNPYDEAFVDQLELFLPKLVDARFLGGEPFLNSLYYEIWDRVTRLNPGLRVQITTNGSILNERVKSVLARLNAHIIVSVDSLDRSNYERIRVNADYDRLHANLDWFRRYSSDAGRALAISVCPMRQNWMELPALLRFCNEQRFALFFNTVFNPPEASLRTLGRKELDAVVRYLETALDPAAARANSRRIAENFRTYASMLNQLRHWARASDIPAVALESTGDAGRSSPVSLG